MPKQIVSPAATIAGFVGLNEKRLLNGPPQETTSLDNVKVRNGVVEGRQGSALWGDVSTTADDQIIGLWEYYRSGTAAGTLIRMTSNKLAYWSGSAWTDITGTDFTGASNGRPQAVTMGEIQTFILVNEGVDRPRKYNGTGNSAVLGGTPPYAKAIEQYVGFLALGNISLDGSTFFPLDVILSDDPDGTWVECDDTQIYVTTLTLDESPGEIRALKVLGLELLAYKSDAIVAVRFTGGVTRFSRRKLDFPMGILAPLSLQSVGANRHIFLAQDRNLYLVDGQTVTPLPPKAQKSLRDMSATYAPWACSAVKEEDETYELFYQRSGSTYMDGRLTINYRTGEVTKAIYPFQVVSATGFRATQNEAQVLVVGAISPTATQVVYQLDTGTNDAGTAISRYFDLDWSDLGVSGTKYLTGCEFVFERARDCRVRISVAVDKSNKFNYGKWFDLQGHDPEETQVRVSYNIPSPVYGTWFKIRVEMFHDAATNVAKLLDYTPELIRVQPASVDTPALSTPNQT